MSVRQLGESIGSFFVSVIPAISCVRPVVGLSRRADFCLSVMSYARLHLWADLEETLQRDLVDTSDGHGGGRMWNHPYGPLGWG